MQRPRSLRNLAATGPPYIVVFPLDTGGGLRQNPRQHSSVARVAREIGSAPPRPAPQKRAGRRGETICNFCPASPCNALIRNARHEANGSGQTPLGPSVSKAAAPAAAIPFAMSRHHSAHASACAHVHSQHALRCGLVPAEPFRSKKLAWAPLPPIDLRICAPKDLDPFSCGSAHSAGLSS